MQNPKEKYIRNTLTSGLKEASDLQTPKWTNDQIDLEKHINLPSLEFVEIAFKVALLRNASAAEKEIFRGYINNGATNAALAYILLSSDEIPQNIQKLNVQKYKIAFEKFSNPRSIKNNKLIRWLRAALGMPVRSKSFFKHTTAKLDDILNRLKNLEQIMQATEQNIDTISKTADSNQKLLFDNQKMFFDNQKMLYENLIIESTQNLGILARKMDENQIDTQRRLERCKTVIPSFAGGSMAVQMDGIIMAVPSEEWRLAMFLNLYGHFEPGSERLFQSILKPEMNVVDVGANLGVYTLHALKAGCTTYSFEPAPRTYALLCDNILINGFEDSGRFHTYQNAVSDRYAELSFNVYPGLSGHNTLFAKTEGNAEIIPVQAVTLDETLKNVSHIDVVKIDVEGAESFVLRGMKNIIQNNKNLKIFMEFAPSHLKRGGTDPKEFLEEIKTYDFKIQAIDDITGELNPIEDEKIINAFSVNLLLEKAKG